MFAKWIAYDNAGNMMIYPDIDNFNGTSYYLDVDNIAPGKVLDLETSIPSAANKVTLNWTAVSDNGYDPGGANEVDRYIIRYSESPISSEEDFESANNVSNTAEDTCYQLVAGNSVYIIEPGEEQVCNVTTGMVLDNHSYYFAVKAVDHVGNEGERSDSVEGKTGYFDIELLWTNLTMLKNGKMYNDSGNTIYQYDLINVTGEFMNNGNREEEVLVRLGEEGYYIMNQTVNLTPNEVKNVSFIYNSTLNDYYIPLLLSGFLPQYGPDMNATNDYKNWVISSWSVKDNVNLIWYMDDFVPAPTGILSDERFLVYSNLTKKYVDTFYDLELTVNINDTFTINGTDASIYCNGLNETCYGNFTGGLYGFYWWINPLPAGDYEVSVTAGSYPEDQSVIYRNITISP
ncbi:hypothetical protein CMO89_01750 [Candidatus Woesearchaeota archaeon]|nr:hypothetical protein [Candidatus Woesearchaeota archaeon]|tara:strand:+ start:3234 stop:4439 length:1206 start_codon:yes stop_codon:yes gene_type:complete